MNTDSMTSGALLPGLKDSADLGLISDTRNLSSLRRMAAGSKREQAEALKTAAAQFEALLVQQWFDAVRSGNESLCPDSPLRSKYSSFFEDMLAQQQVSSMVNGRGWTDFTILLDENSDLKRAMNVQTQPTVFVLDREGNVISGDFLLQ